MPDLIWQKSSYSGEAANCLETAPTSASIHIRDSKSPSRPHLTVSPAAWSGFVSLAAGVDSRSFQ
ncbi:MULTISPECIES: DUF397 domain-containing protein [unclassified Streptomyces]|uniref:DUF397 domain-containing protein n=1 Tax=Streptomyces niveiscabiei TaxID=164115 RepID=A0ABW9HIJ4_9ACTN|nr:MULTISPECIES: DUF397 domain-containing protein [unclassified Streptomyces]QZZ28196.1 DUF397 domain-containing protein [Streptomyces sp. ST1015]